MAEIAQVGSEYCLWFIIPKRENYIILCLLEIDFIELWVKYDLNERNLVYNLTVATYFSVK